MTPFRLATCYTLQKIRFVGVPALQNGGWVLSLATNSLCPDLARYQAPTARGISGGGLRGEAHRLQPAGGGPAEHPIAALQQILETLPPYPTPSNLQNVRRWLEDSGLCAGIPASLVAIGGRVEATAVTRDSDAILAYITGLLQPNTSNAADRHWARACLPELLLLLARLHIPSHPKLEGPLILILRRGKLPTPDFLSSIPSCRNVAGSAANSNANTVDTPLLHRRRDCGQTTLLKALSHPTAFRLCQSMAALAVNSHEAWQQLAERHFLARPGLLLDCLGPDQLTLVAAAFARAGYHHIELFRSIADRLLPAVPHLQPGSLARGLHAFASLRHQDPHLIPALCREVNCRMRGGGTGSSGSGGAGRGGGTVAAGSTGGSAAAGGGVAGSSLLSLAGAALFGGTRGGRPDRAHRAPQFLLDDLARLAAAAVQLGVGEAAARGYGGGNGFGDGLGEQLLEAVADEAEEAVAVRMKIVLEAVRAAAAVAEDAEMLLSAAVLRPNGPRPRVRSEQNTEQITQPSVDGHSNRANGEYDMYDRYGAEDIDGQEPDSSERCRNGDARDLCDPWVGSSNSCGISSSLPADQLEPILTLLEALVAGGAAGGAGCAAARAAHAITAQHLVPELPSLKPYMSPRHLISMLAALLPGPGAASLLQPAHPYPGPAPPQRVSSPHSQISAYVSGVGGRVGGVGGYNRQYPDAVASRAEYAPGDRLAAVVAALIHRTDLRFFRSGRHVLDAWHLLAASRAGGTAGADDPRVTGQLLAPVFAFVVRHMAMLGSAPEASRFFVSCALLSAYNRAALDAMAAPLVVALGGGGGATSVRQPPSGQRAAVCDGSGRWITMAGCRTGALPPWALAQLAWAVGQLGYDNAELLAVIQNQALALSAPFPSVEHQRRMQPHADEDPAGSGCSAAAAAAAGLAAAAPPLGPLELADVMWCLAVNQFRTNLGAEIRELYIRAAIHGVVHIDDPRWLRLVQVHVLLLLGWAGGLGEAAAGRLRSGWFNALGYAWEHQAVHRGEQLAGPTGLPPDPDAAVGAFRQSVTTSVRDLIRAGIPPAASSHDAGGSSGAGGRWRLQANYVWGMLQPSSDIRLTVPLLVRFKPASAEKAAATFRGDGLAVGASSGGGNSNEWVVALDLVRCADEAAMVAAAAAPVAAEASTVLRVFETVGGPAPPPHQQQQGQAGESYGVGAHLLGPARWRHLVLRRLGVIVRPVRQEDWERADGQERGVMLLHALQL